MATEHLIEQGCRRIAHLGGHLTLNIYRERQSGYIDALKKHGIDINENLIVHKLLIAESGIDAAKYFLDLAEPPDGIFCANDTSAVSVIQLANEMGVKIPDDLAIIGFNNDPVSSIITPELSTIDHPAVDMGNISASQILKLLSNENNNKFKTFETIVLDTKLLVRKSSNRKVLMPE